MKVVILAGGKGTRLGSITAKKPKALVEIGGKPIIWHVMKYFSNYGYHDFVIALGHNKEYFERSWLELHTKNDVKEWKIELIDTGTQTQTGGRIKRLKKILNQETFMLAWCDGLSDINLFELLSFHKKNKKLVTVAAVHPPSRFGHLSLNGVRVKKFLEKPILTDKWVNGGFFVVEPAALDYIDGDNTQWEKEPLQRLAQEDQLVAYRHGSFWQCMDTMYDKNVLEGLWNAGDAPWKIWS
jgi:glucose-1-phosphate cytidylyltransferase